MEKGRNRGCREARSQIRRLTLNSMNLKVLGKPSENFKQWSEHLRSLLGMSLCQEHGGLMGKNETESQVQ